MGGKTLNSASQVSIPPEVLARYNAVNAKAETAASRDFQQYPGQFVAPLTATQQGAMQGVNNAQGLYSPYGREAYERTQEGMRGADFLNQAAADQYRFGGEQGRRYLGAAGEAATGAMAPAESYLSGATGQVGRGLDTSRAALMAGQPYLNAATSLGLAGAQAITPSDLNEMQIKRYMSPYIQTVIGGTLAPLQQQQQMEQSKLLGDASSVGALGGTRDKLARAVLAGQQNMATGNVVAGLLNPAYSQALSTAQQQQGVGLGAAQANRAALQQVGQQMAALGQQGYGQQMGVAEREAAAGQQLAALGQQGYAQKMGLSQALQGLGAQGYQQEMGLGQATAGLGQQIYGQRMAAGQQLGALGSQALQNELAARQAQFGMGTAEQQTQQAQNQALYNQFLQEQGYPFQIAQFLANIAMGTGALSGSTTSGTQTAPFFSDRRLKHDVRRIGETDDGMPIYKFKYKGDPKEQTHIGFMADDVEKEHPEAVGLAGGYKTVDYDKATKAYGGALSSEGGAVTTEREGLGFAAGGTPIVSPGDLQEILSSQAQSLGLYNGKGLYGGAAQGTPGATGFVPQGGVHSSSLQIAALPERAKTGLSELADTAGNVSDLVDKGTAAYEGAKDLYGKYDKWRDDKELESAMDEISPNWREGRYSGGLVRNRYAVGGLPYSQGEGYVPEESIKTPAELHASQAGLAGSSGLDQMGKAASGISKIYKAGKDVAKVAAMFAHNGGVAGRSGYADGGADDDFEKRKSDLNNLVKRESENPILRDISNAWSGVKNYVSSLAVPPDRSNERGLSADSGAVPYMGIGTTGATGTWEAPAEGGLAPVGGGPADPLPEPINVATRAAESPAIEETPSTAGLAPQQRSSVEMPQVNQQALTKTIEEKENKEPGWFSRNQNWLVPLLKGVGTMASSQSPYFGTALLQGVGAAAGASQDIQNQILNRDAKEASMLQTYSQMLPEAIRGFYQPVRGEGGKIKFVKLTNVLDTKKPVVSDQGIEGNKFVKPVAYTFDPESGKYSFDVSPTTATAKRMEEQYGIDSSSDRALDNLTRVRTNPSLAAQDFNEEKRVAERLSRDQNIENMHTELLTLTEAILFPGEGIAAAGKGQFAVQPLINMANWAARAMGVEGEPYGWQGNETASDVVTKIRNFLGTQQAQTTGQHAAAIASALSSSLPGREMTPEAAQIVATNLLKASQMERDFVKYAPNYTNKLGVHLDLQNNFNNDIVPTLADESKKLSAMMKSKVDPATGALSASGEPLLRFILKNKNKLDDADKKKLQDAGVARWLNIY